MSTLPAGTVTFVFTDIEDSTTLIKELGERYGGVLREHRGLVRETLTTANGTEIDSQGDAFFFAFPRARDAVAGAVEVQRRHAARDWPDGRDVRVRIGLHTGEPALGDEGYHGLDVVRAARICTAGAGGQVLLSEATHALIGSSLPEGVAVFPLGERHLKGLDEPERVYELEIDGAAVARPARAAPPAAADEDRSEDLEKKIERRVEESILRMLDASLEKVTPKPKPPRSPDEDVEQLAERGASLNDQIRATVDAALRASGIPRKT
ncbi:MAG TPA: adenylate/guanylate cyclase domain-containing protein [Gaiellaceae bacterium]|nr:adenylate/guanylate cyclase domain-containing protein [Gaiellaceae bacterium]